MKNTNKTPKTLIGVDEAGRGPLAGPVAVGAFAVRSEETLRFFADVKDSKQLSESKREEWFAKIRGMTKAGLVSYAVSFSSERVIDREGISKAVYLSVCRSVRKLEKKGFSSLDSKILLDGLLKAGRKYEDQETIVGGDESEPLIALASICAKVMRDRKMCRLSRRYPEYGFEIHKGYGTRGHYEAIKKHGVSPIHRRTFLKSLKIR